MFSPMISLSISLLEAISSVMFSFALTAEIANSTARIIDNIMIYLLIFNPPHIIENHSKII